MYTAHVHFFTNLDLFCIDNARVICRKIRYLKLHTVSVRRRQLDVLFLTSVSNDLTLALPSWKLSACLCRIEIVDTFDQIILILNHETVLLLDPLRR